MLLVVLAGRRTTLRFWTVKNKQMQMPCARLQKPIQKEAAEPLEVLFAVDGESYGFMLYCCKMTWNGLILLSSQCLHYGFCLLYKEAVLEFIVNFSHFYRAHIFILVVSLATINKSINYK